MAQMMVSSIEQIDELNNEAYSLRLRDMQKALLLCQQSLDLATTVNYIDGQAKSLLIQAEIHVKRGDQSRVLALIDDAIMLCDQLEDPDCKARALGVLGSAHRFLGGYDIALQKHMEQLRIYETRDDIGGQAIALNQIARVYALSGKFRLAEEHLERSLDIFHTLNDPVGQANVLSDFCELYMTASQYDRVLDYALKSYNLYKSVDDQYGQALVLGIIGRAYAAQHKEEQALAYFHHALDLRREQGLRALEADLLYEIGLFYRHVDQDVLALEMLTQSLKLAEQLSRQRLIYKCHYELYRLTKAHGDLAKALDHHERFHEAKELVFNETSEAMVRNLEVTHRTEAARREAYLLSARNAELEQMRAHEKVHFERISRLRDDFLGATSHDLKTPLSGVGLAVDMLRRELDGENPRVNELLSRIDTNIEQMRLLISDLLDLARLEIQHVPEEQPVTVAPFIEDVVEDLRLAAERKAVDLRVDVDPPEMQTLLDPGQMRQALMNLISNGIKYTPEGGLVRVDATQKGRVLIISVSDNGYGIPEEAMEHIFERFYRAKDTADAVQGTGLGLAIVKSIVEGHNGTISVQSRPGQGSTFTLRLPYRVV